MRNRYMKKIIKLIIAIIFALAVIGGITFLVDCSSIRSEKEPVFARMTKALNDGGTVIYTGLGYKIINFNMLNGYDEVKVGTWFMKYEDFKEEYEKYNKNVVPSVDNKTNNEKEEKLSSGDIIKKDSGEKILPSGENIINSGENNSGDEIVVNNDTKNKPDETVLSGDDSVSGDLAKKEKLSFIGSITGVKNNILVVTPLEDQEISKSSDMISFSVEKIGTKQDCVIGQKIKVTYSGDIKETYPAQIDAVEVEVIKE